MLRLKKPAHLEPGDTGAAVSLSWGGPGTFPHRYQAGKRQLEETFGVRVVETPHALRDAEWLSRNPKARADDLMEAFSDPSVRGIISTIGGDDSIRILRHLASDGPSDDPTRVGVPPGRAGCSPRSNASVSHYLRSVSWRTGQLTPTRVRSFVRRLSVGRSS
jgi:hypothetical protein